MTMNRSNGFTLIELMITVAMAAIVLTLGVPSFQEIIRNNRLATQTNAFVGALSLARSEAVKRGVRVTVCKSADGAACIASGGYEQGWIVFTDPDNDAIVDAGETIIRVSETTASTGITLTGTTGNVADYVSYTADGITRLASGTPSGAFQAGTLTVCKAPKARQIVINKTGRIRTTETTCP